MTSSSAAPPSRIAAGSPAAILAIVPHLLGFSPQDSLVIIGALSQDGRIKVTLRYDLPDPADPAAAAEIAAHALGVLTAQDLTVAIAVGYGPDDRVAPLSAALRDAAASAGVDLAESLRAEGSRYWSYLCSDQECCPAEGTPFDPAAHVASIAMAGAGLRGTGPA